MSYKLTNYERETIITYNDGDKIASVYTCNKTLQKRLSGYCSKRPDIFKLEEADLPSKTFTFPKRLVIIRLPRIMSDQEKEKLVNRLAKGKELVGASKS